MDPLCINIRIEKNKKKSKFKFIEIFYKAVLFMTETNELSKKSIELKPYRSQRT